MKILHLMLSCFYIDGWNYQENALPRQNILDGHEVKIVASTETYKLPNIICYIPPSQYVNEDGIEVIRVPFRRSIPHGLGRKVRAFEGVYGLIEQFSPDVILHHGCSGYEILTVAKYKKNHPTVRFFADNHADFHNSAKSFFSREILHRRFYAPILRKALPYIEKVLCLSLETMDFLEQIYSVPAEKMEFYPLGGRLVTPEEREKRRKLVRSGLAISDGEVLLVHSGKMAESKRTLELLRAFSSIQVPFFKLCLIGSIGAGIRTDAENLMKRDRRISFVGWKNAEELQDYLCAADIYVQPGTQSATMQNALCCSCPVMLYPYKSHKPFLHGNGFFVESEQDIEYALRKIESNPSVLRSMSKASFDIAKELLDYKKLATRLYT